MAMTLVRKPVVQKMEINGEDLYFRTGWYITTVKSNGTPTGEFFEPGAEKDIYFKTGRSYDYYVADEDNAFRPMIVLDISNGLLPLPSDVMENM